MQPLSSTVRMHNLVGLASERFDVLVISWPEDRREPEVVHYRQAFEAVGRFQVYS